MTVTELPEPHFYAPTSPLELDTPFPRKLAHYFEKINFFSITSPTLVSAATGSPPLDRGFSQGRITSEILGLGKNECRPPCSSFQSRMCVGWLTYGSRHDGNATRTLVSLLFHRHTFFTYVGMPLHIEPSQQISRNRA